MRSWQIAIVSVIGIWALMSCVPSQSTVPAPASGATPSVPTRTLIIVDRHEPIDLAPKILAQGGANRTKRLFNASLALLDPTGAPRPLMAQTLPELNTDTWRVFPDGRMETTYPLRPNLTWQDGQALSADDFVFAWQVYSSGVGPFSSTPQDQMESVEAPDPRTLVIRWRTAYPDADALVDTTLDPLPRHILEPSFTAYQQDPTTRDGFLNQPYWTDAYIGAGAFKLVTWDHGIALEGAAFAGYALGRPKIDRVIERIMDDENTIMANVLAGEIQYSTRTTLRFTQGQTLQSEWEAAGKGRVLLDPTAPLFTQVQFRPEYQKTPALLDVRVRRALAYGIDKQGIVDALYGGVGSIADTFVSRQVSYYPDVDRAITKYPYDSQRVAQGMNEAGFVKDADGFFVDGSGERFRPAFDVPNSVDYERMEQVVADAWRRAGIDVQATVTPNEQQRVNEVRHTTPGMTMPGSGVGAEREMLVNFISLQIGTPANRWSGSNRGGWSDSQYDGLFDAFNSTLNNGERQQTVVQAMKLLSDELPAFPLYYNIYVEAVAAELRGPGVGTPATTDYWNVQDWSWQ